MFKKTIMFSSFLLIFVFLFQNCSGDVGFDSAISSNSVESSEINNNGGLDSPSGSDDTNKSDTGIDIVCNPLDPSQPCSPTDSHQGLMGKLYYLTHEIHGAQFNNNLNNAKIDDYRNVGIQVPVNLIMTSVNVTPRSWDTGFFISSGEQVQTESGLKLFEWFHIDMSGFISLPAGNYQFATLSDDGMRVTINNQVLINADGVHGPRYDCANSIVNFVDGEKKLIRVQYFQGPRTQIAMQLLVRSESKSELNCGNGGQFESIGPENFFKN